MTVRELFIVLLNLIFKGKKHYNCYLLVNEKERGIYGFLDIDEENKNVVFW